MMVRVDSISIKPIFNQPQASQIVIQRQEMTQGMSSGLQDTIYLNLKSMIIKEQLCLCINAPRKTLRNFILLIKSGKAILINSMNLFTALIGQMIQNSGRISINFQNLCMYHVIMYTMIMFIQMIQSTKNAYQILKLNKNILVHQKQLCIITMRF